MDYKYLLILLVFPVCHFFKCTILMHKAQKYMTEYDKYWRTGDATFLLIHKTRINNLLNNANYVAKSYLKTELDDINRIMLYRQVPITDVFLEQQFKVEFMETIIVTYGELSRLRTLTFSFNYWIKQLVFIPVRFLSLFGFNFNKVSALIVSVLGWAIAYVSTMYQTEIKTVINVLLEKLMP